MSITPFDPQERAFVSLLAHYVGSSVEEFMFGSTVAACRIAERPGVLRHGMIGLVPRKRYERLTRAEEDQRDAQIARKGREAFLLGKMKTVSLQEARRRWGV